METMHERQNEGMDALMEKRMKKVFVRWLQENDYDEAAFLEKYSEEELVMQYVIDEERSRIYLADDLGGQAEILCEFPTDRIGESRDLIGEVTLQASWIAWIAMDKLYGAEHNNGSLVIAKRRILQYNGQYSNASERRFVTTWFIKTSWMLWAILP